jgi:hypothetical protein
MQPLRATESPATLAVKVGHELYVNACSNTLTIFGECTLPASVRLDPFVAMVNSRLLLPRIVHMRELDANVRCECCVQRCPSARSGAQGDKLHILPPHSIFLCSSRYPVFPTGDDVEAW